MNAADFQRLEALDLAQRARAERSATKRAIREGRLDVVDVIRSPGEAVWTMPVGKLLAAQHYVGDGRARRLCRRAKLEPERALGSLTAPQRERLIGEMA